MENPIFPDLYEKTVVITGGGRGIGLGAARRFAELGSKVVLLDLVSSLDNLSEPDADGWQRVLDQPTMDFVTVDVTDPDAVQAVAEQVKARYGAAHVVLNAAGIVRSVAAEDMSFADWQDVVDVDLTGVFLSTQAFGRDMIAAGRGSIVNIASMSGSISNFPQKQVSYNAAKAGVIHLSKTIGGEWAEYGVRVNSISPGYIGTEMTLPSMEKNPDWTKAWLERVPQGRVGTVDEVSNVILFLASEASSYVVGADFVVDGGYTVW